MSKIKNILATLAVAATATLSLTFAVSAATADTPSVQSIGWTKTSTGYWVGSDEVDLSIYSNSFSFINGSKFRSRLTVQEGIKGSITGIDGHEGNYKSITVTLTNKENKVTYDSDWGTKDTISVKPTYSGTLYSANFFGKILDGTGERASVLEGYNLTLTNSK